MTRSHYDLGDWRDPDKAIDALKKAVAAGVEGEVYMATHGAWSFGYSFHAVMGHCFSAKLRQNRSKERDWEILGRCAARIGAPEEARPATIEGNPEATHYFLWGSTAPREEIVRLNQQAQRLWASKSVEAKRAIAESGILGSEKFDKCPHCGRDLLVVLVSTGVKLSHGTPVCAEFTPAFAESLGDDPVMRERAAAAIKKILTPGTN